jgi:hypothetical protein
MSILQNELPGDSWDFPRYAPIPLARFFDELLELYRPPLRSKRTLSKMRSVASMVVALAGPDAKTSDLTPQLIGRFVDSRPESESGHTTYAYLSYFRAACNYAKSRGYLQRTPFEFRKRWVRKGPAKPKQHHSMAEIRHVLDQLAAEVREREGWPRWRARRLQALVATVAYRGPSIIGTETYAKPRRPSGRHRHPSAATTAIHPGRCPRPARMSSVPGH